ncbi:MAG: homoserine kinase [Alphaproteobacteria bacterium]|nr:homoserine kinase [Alphaproteobacteria bacterium]
MAVYTRIPDDELQQFVKRYALGNFISITDILAGVENSNFFLKLDTGTYILTIYEKRVNEEDLPFFMDLMRHLAAKGIPCPTPIADAKGNVLQRLCNKPAALVSFLNGKARETITPYACREAGIAAATMHRATADFKGTRANGLSFDGWATLITRCMEKGDDVKAGITALITSEFDYLKKHWPQKSSMPFGAVHADFFPDNVFFENDKLCGVIDFYFACSEFLAYDLAITINAWCFDDAHTLVPERLQAMLDGYQSIRPLTADEKAAMPLFLRGAALRFLLTRLHDMIYHPPGALVTPKDPLEYYKKLTFFQGFTHEW